MISLVDRLMLLFNCEILPLEALFFDCGALLKARISTVANAFHGLLLLLVLSHDLGGYHFGDRHGEDSVADRLQHDDPIVAASAIGHLPIFGLRVPTVAATDSCLNLIESDRGITFVLMNDCSLIDDIREHLFDYVRLQRQPIFFSVAVKLLQGDAIVHILVAGTEEGSYDVMGDLQGGVSLVHVLRWSLVVTPVDDLFHTHGEERLLCFKGSFLNGTAVTLGILFLLHPQDMIDDLVTLVSVPWFLIEMRGIVHSGAVSL